MSRGHADTIPDHVHLLKSVLAWGGTKEVVGSVTLGRANEALDALLAENQRLEDRLAKWQAMSARFVAENQRLREALAALVKWSETIGADEDSEVHALFGFAREALAGDGDTPNLDESPFQMPRLETVEKGIRGPWNDKEWENDNG